MAKPKETIKYKVLHRFACEHCGEMDEWKTSIIEAKTQNEIHDTKIPEIQKEVEENNYFSLAQLDGKCPKCGKLQSWGIEGAKKMLMRSPAIGLVAAGSLGWIAWFLFGFVGFLVVFVVVALFGFIYGLALYIRTRLHMKKTFRRNIPEINWMDAQTSGEVGMDK